jgi:hypothetical protein
MISRTTSLQLELEEAIQMLRLVADGKRTTVEVKEWLDQHHPEPSPEDELVKLLLRTK